RPVGALGGREGGWEALRPLGPRAGGGSGDPRRRGHRAEVLERRHHPLHVAPAHVPARAGVSAQPARSASSTLAGCASALATFAPCFFTLPSGPIPTVERLTPTAFLPYITSSP